VKSWDEVPARHEHLHLCAQANQAVLRRLLAERPIELGLSVITEAELRTGIAKSAAAIKNARLLENFLRPLTVVEFTSDDALVYAAVRAKLERAGTPIGPLDTLIAAQALARKLTLVSNNQREFKRIPALRLENWASG
jgi:tRNA(fMet)-specific endonuclease VapC